MSRFAYEVEEGSPAWEAFQATFPQNIYSDWRPRADLPDDELALVERHMTLKEGEDEDE